MRGIYILEALLVGAVVTIGAGFLLCFVIAVVATLILLPIKWFSKTKRDLDVLNIVTGYNMSIVYKTIMTIESFLYVLYLVALAFALSP